MLRFPAARRKVNAELDKVRLDLEQGMVPHGPDVVRHLALPEQSQSPDWIAQEMERMDKEGKGHANWAEGRVSGAVYRALFSSQ